MPMKNLALLIILIWWSPLSLADHVTYEYGSYRDKLVLSYTNDLLTLHRNAVGKEPPNCSTKISKDTLTHSLDFFHKIELNNWKSSYFADGQMDGVTFSLDILIGDFQKTSIGHAKLAPKEHEKLVRYFNQLLVVNGCQKGI